MDRRQSLIAIVLLLLCGGILVLFTDLELSLVRWVNCGPWSGPSERSSEVCR
jgi:hypothetical protein